MVAEDVGIDGAAASAEEAAMHIISEEDLRNQGDEDLDGDDEEACQSDRGRPTARRVEWLGTR